MSTLKILFVVLTHKRPTITSLCLNTLLNNTSIKPDSLWILDDGSGIDMQTNLFNISKDVSDKININLSLRFKNDGVGYSFEHAYNIINTYEPDIAVISENDYVWRKGWLEDIVALYNSNKYVVGIPGTSHPDMYQKEKTHGSFIDLMKEQWGEDIISRQYMYIPFNIDTKNGPIKVQGVSNSCGCNILFWNRLKDILKSSNTWNLYWHWMERAFHKWGGEPWGRSRASDAHMTGTISYLWEKYAQVIGLDLSKNFAWLDICDYTIAQHVCGGQDSINGKIVPEGSTFILSPCWKNEYLEKNPRQITT